MVFSFLSTVFRMFFSWILPQPKHLEISLIEGTPPACYLISKNESKYTTNLLKTLFSKQQLKMKSNSIGIVIFDGICGICNKTMQFIDKYESNCNVFMGWAQNKDIVRDNFIRFCVSFKFCILFHEI